MTDEELIARLRGACYLAFDDGTNDYGTAPNAADRIEALVKYRDAYAKMERIATEALRKAEARAEMAHQKSRQGEGRAQAEQEPEMTLIKPRVGKSWDELSDEEIYETMNVIQQEIKSPREEALMEAVNVCKVFQANARTNDAWLHACEIEEAILALIEDNK